jgi:hypothetical protein
LTVLASALAGSAFAIIAKPTIKTFAPLSAKVGATVTITGKSFTGTSAVRFGGVKANFKVRSATKITATVPAAIANGIITVTTKHGIGVSAKSFTVATATITVTPKATTTYAANGSGTLTISPGTATAGSSGNTLTFTYTAATGGLFNGSLLVTIPDGWTPPVTTATAGCVSGTTGVIATSGQVIDVFNLVLPAGGTAVFTYGAKSGQSFTGSACGANSGATAPAAGTYTFGAQEKSSNNITAAAGELTSLGSSPTVTVS